MSIEETYLSMSSNCTFVLRHRLAQRTLTTSLCNLYLTMYDLTTVSALVPPAE